MPRGHRSRHSPLPPARMESLVCDGQGDYVLPQRRHRRSAPPSRRWPRALSRLAGALWERRSRLTRCARRSIGGPVRRRPPGPSPCRSPAPISVAALRTTADAIGIDREPGSGRQRGAGKVADAMPSPISTLPSRIEPGAASAATSRSSSGAARVALTAGRCWTRGDCASASPSA